MVALADAPRLDVGLLSPRVREVAAAPAELAPPLAGVVGLSGNLRERMERLEMAVIGEAMQRHRGNKSRAARELGLSRVGLRAKLARYGLEGEA